MLSHNLNNQPNMGHGTLQLGDVTNMLHKPTGETHQVKIIERRVVGWLAEDTKTGEQFVVFQDSK